MSYIASYARNSYSEMCQSKQGFFFVRYEKYYNGHKSWGKWLPVIGFERNELGHVIAYTGSGETDVYTVIEVKEVNYRLPKTVGIVNVMPDFYAKDGLIMIEDKYCDEYGAYEVAHVGYKGVRYSLSNRYETKLCYRGMSPDSLVDLVLEKKGIVKTANCLNDCQEKSINGFAADFPESLDKDDLIFESFGEGELLDNQDIILQYPANMLVSYLDYLKLADNPEKLLVHSNWLGKGGDKLVILKSGECVYIVNTAEKPENVFNDLLGGLPSYTDADKLSFNVVAVIEGE